MDKNEVTFNHEESELKVALGITEDVDVITEKLEKICQDYVSQQREKKEESKVSELSEKINSELTRAELVFFTTGLCMQAINKAHTNSQLEELLKALSDSVDSEE